MTTQCTVVDSGPPTESPDSGAGTALAAIVSVGLLAVFLLIMQLGAAVLSRHRAEGAADLAALAAAAYAHQGQQFACSRAEWVAEHMHARLAKCRLDGWEARVWLRMELPGILSQFEPVKSHARAGPSGA